MLEKETEMAVQNLPATVPTAFERKKIKEVALIIKGDKTYYEAEVGGKGLIFTADGRMVPKI